MQITLTVVKNILEPHKYETEFLDFTNLLDLLKIMYPEGFKFPSTVGTITNGLCC